MITATPEGREGIYLLTPEEAKKLVKQQVTGDEVHHQFAGTGPMIIGADWQKEDVLNYLDKPGNQIALVLEPNPNMGHALVVINRDEGERSQFDIGKITADMLTIAAPLNTTDITKGA